MKLSLFSPTHNTQYLKDTYASIKAQPGLDLEWVLVPNAARDKELPQIPVEILADPMTKVYEFRHDGKPRIGELKRYACEKATGDVFVELDHDDMLVPGVLRRVADAVKDGAGFVYSDAASFINDQAMTPWTYDERWGWETYEFQVYGRTCRATKTFDITPKALCEVYFAPDHVRCWSREAYYKAGGHDATMTVGDDHDLICRTYLAGAKFTYTESCGYLYRFHPTNTVKSHNGQIQKQQNANRDKYFYKLLDEWLRRTNYGYLDMAKKPLSYEKGVPKIEAATNSVGVIRAWNDVLPMIPRGQETAFMNEVYRVLVPGGYFCCYFPTTEGLEAFAPHYKSFWNERTFDYYTQKDLAKKLPGVTCRFQLVRRGTMASSADRKKHRLLDTYVDLCALKGQRQPGRVYI
jgi:glycosyltransferase involved in cell wall biosynthesis